MGRRGAGDPAGFVNVRQAWREIANEWPGVVSCRTFVRPMESKQRLLFPAALAVLNHRQPDGESGLPWLG
jgi:hypothetical protein